MLLPMILRAALHLILPLAFLAPAVAAEKGFSFEDARALVRTHCVTCHRGAAAPAGLDLSRFSTMRSMLENPGVWDRVLARVRNGEMPPKGQPAPTLEARDAFVAWVDRSLLQSACADGVSPGPVPVRRLNRSEYAATVRDLLNIHFNAGHALPADGAGGEGFDNAAETLFLSPIHAEKYLEAAKQALEYGAKDPRSRARFIVVEPKGETTPEQAARKILDDFLPRAFRRPAAAGEVERYMKLFDSARSRRDDFDDSILFSLRGVLISPHFLFRVVKPNPGREPRLLDDYEMASRLSYFLWGSMPDQVLFELAAGGKLQDPVVLDEQVTRMLRDPRALGLAEPFVEQWLGTRELGREVKPDPKLFPEFDAELLAAIRYEPILFFQEILSADRPLTELLDSKVTILNNKLARHYGFRILGLKQQPSLARLPDDSERGGIVTMAAILAVNSYPHRTSPVLRGKWVLDAIFGTPPPPPPPDVPALVEAHDPEAPKTLRERLVEHRRQPACATCHNRMDPIGFGLENYDVLGRYRTEDAGMAIDSKGELPDGRKFEGARELKAILFDQKDVFIRNLTTKLLAYALGRGLTIEDRCAVDAIVDQLKSSGYCAHTLVREIVRSVPFRYQPGTPAAAPRGRERPKTAERIQ
jgi:mono/diheme cytochrome c family protein